MIAETCIREEWERYGSRYFRGVVKRGRGKEVSVEVHIEVSIIQPVTTELCFPVCGRNLHSVDELCYPDLSNMILDQSTLSIVVSSHAFLRLFSFLPCSWDKVLLPSFCSKHS